MEKYFKMISQKKLINIGFSFLLFGSITPILNGLRILFFQLPVKPQNYWLHYFASIGPWNLMLTGIFGFINILYLKKSPQELAWYLHLVGVIWVGGGDSVEALIFLSKINLPIFPLILPVIVTTINIFGLILIKKFAFKQINLS
jgi:hypothetical protein